MKKLTLIFIFILLSIASVCAIEINSTSEPNATASITQATLDVSSFRYEPYPAEPGEYFTAWFTIKNLGKNPAYNTYVEIIEDYPFSVDGETKKTIEKIAPGQEILFKIDKIRIDEEALEGENKLKIQYPGPYNTLVKKEIPITVRTVLPSIETSITSNPERIPQGQIATINISIKNSDTSTIRDVRIGLELPEELSSIGSIPEKKIPRLQPGQEGSVSFNILASADAEGRAYKTPIIITFSDETGTLNTKNQTIGILVGDGITYDVNIEEGDAFSQSKKGSITLSLANIGPNTIKFLTFEIQPDENYRVISNNKVYMGNLDPDDFETAEFIIATSVQKEGNNCWIPLHCNTPREIPIKAKLQYRDSYNTLYENNLNITLPIYSASELKAYGLAGSSGIGIGTIIIIILLIIYVYLTFTNWRHSKHLPTALKQALAQEARGGVNILKSLRWRNIKRIPRKISRFFNEP